MLNMYADLHLFNYIENKNIKINKYIIYFLKKKKTKKKKMKKS